MARDGTPSGGRKKGGKNKKTLAMEAAVAKTGTTPLEVMLDTMLYFLGMAAAAETEEERIKAKREASAQAERAAPYVHSRMPQGVQVQGTINLTFSDRRDEKL
jgi:hypothetical protein